MRLISLVNFPDDGTTANLTSVLNRLGFVTKRGESPDQLEVDGVPVFVWGECAGFLEVIRQIRMKQRKTFIIIATHLPDYTKWLDALEAGANDYCCVSLTADKMGWLLLPEAQFRSHEPHVQRGSVLMG